MNILCVFVFFVCVGEPKDEKRQKVEDDEEKVGHSTSTYLNRF